MYTWPIFIHPGYWGIQDWDAEFFVYEIPRLTIARYRQFPLWNPFYCGGMPMLAMPVSAFLTPFFVLQLAFGTVFGMKMQILAHVFLAIVGSYCLARQLELDRLPAALASAVYALSSMFAVNLAGGMAWFMSAAFLPWAFLFAVRGLSRASDVIGCAISLVLMLGSGGCTTLAIALLLLGLYCLAAGTQDRSKAPIIGLLATLALTFFLGAVKFVPAIEFLLQFPRPMHDHSGFSLAMLLHGLTGRIQTFGTESALKGGHGLLFGHDYGMDENGMYIGWIPLALCALGALAGGSRHRELGLLLIFFLYAGLGDRVRPSLWELLRCFPVYSSIRVAQRVRMASLLLLALFAGSGLQELRRIVELRVPPRRARAVAAVVLGVVLVDLFTVNWPVWMQAFPIPPLATHLPGAFAQIGQEKLYDARGFVAREHAFSSSSAHFPAALQNEGSIRCYSGMFVNRAAIPREDAAYRGEVFLDAASGRVDFASWSPNRLTINVHADHPGYVIVNQNYSHHWRSGDGRPVLARAGLLAVPVSPQDARVELAYKPLSFAFGAALSLATLLAIAGWAVWRRTAAR